MSKHKLPWAHQRAIDTETTGLAIYDPAKHVAYLRRGLDWWMKEHRDQVMGLMWITGWKKYYVSSFHPDFPTELQMILWEVERDESYIRLLESRVLAFRDLLLEEYNRLGGAF